MSARPLEHAVRAAVAVPVLTLLVLCLAGCGDNGQNVLHPASGPERRITTLWWVMMVGAWIGFGVVVFLLSLGWFHRRKAGLPLGGGDRLAVSSIVGLGIAVPVVVLSLLFVYSDIFVIRSTAAPARGSTERTIVVVGNQWFWEAQYPGTDAVTADEIHIPVRTRVDVRVRTDDVIHSFWVPELNRKIDLIPGRTTSILLYAERPGVYRGQCAEFCGLQHAHMGLYVFADPPAKFRAWLRNMSRAGPAPTSAAARRGEQVFLSQACSACHTIRGTSARGDVGPDLTHVASRSTLAALTIPNTPQELRAWIENPQRIKPGAKMPGLALTRSQLDDLVAFLEGLK